MFMIWKKKDKILEDFSSLKGVITTQISQAEVIGKTRFWFQTLKNFTLLLLLRLKSAKEMLKENCVQHVQHDR